MEKGRDLLEEGRDRLLHGMVARRRGGLGVLVEQALLAG